MVKLEEQIKSLQTKVQQILKQYQALLRENHNLKKEVEKYQADTAGKHEKIATLQQQLDVLKIGSQGWTSETKKDLEKRIETYLREVEKCLAMLNA